MPTSFAPPPGRDGPLLSADMLQRMQAFEQRAPILYAGMPERPEQIHRFCFKKPFKLRLQGS